jgi:hypothetical protein
LASFVVRRNRGEADQFFGQREGFAHDYFLKICW